MRAAGETRSKEEILRDVWGDPDARDTNLVEVYVGYLRKKLDAPYGTNLPHPQVFDLPDGQRVLVTFDGTQYGKRVLGYGTHGDVIVMRAR